MKNVKYTEDSHIGKVRRELVEIYLFALALLLIGIVSVIL